MGIEVLAIAAAGLQLASTYEQAQNSQNQAEALAEEGELKAEESAKLTAATAASNKVSFLTSGFTMEGTPSAVMASTYQTGKEDASQIISNYQTQADSIISSARSSALTSLAGMASSFAGGMSTASTASYLPDSALYSMNDMGFGNLSYEALELKDLRGY